MANTTTTPQRVSSREGGDDYNNNRFKLQGYFQCLSPLQVSPLNCVNGICNWAMQRDLHGYSLCCVLGILDSIHLLLLPLPGNRIDTTHFWGTSQHLQYLFYMHAARFLYWTKRREEIDPNGFLKRVRSAIQIQVFSNVWHGGQGYNRCCTLLGISNFNKNWRSGKLSQWTMVTSQPRKHESRLGSFGTGSSKFIQSCTSLSHFSWKCNTLLMLVLPYCPCHFISILNCHPSHKALFCCVWKIVPINLSLLNPQI